MERWEKGRGEEGRGEKGKKGRGWGRKGECMLPNVIVERRESVCCGREKGKELKGEF